MKDPDFWKRKFQDQWADSNKREQSVALEITNKTGLTVSFHGFGANSTEFISGTAAQNGHEKGDSDLEIKDLNALVEVTGPLTGVFDESRDLWIRPDKYKYAKKKFDEGKQMFLVHCLGQEGIRRVIFFNQEFFDSKLEKVYPTIRGAPTTFICIPPNHVSLKSFDYFIEFLKKQVKVSA